MSQCAKNQNCTHTHITHFGNTTGIPVPVRNPSWRAHSKEHNLVVYLLCIYLILYHAICHRTRCPYPWVGEMCIQLATLFEALLFDMQDWVHWEKLVSYCSYNNWEDIYTVFEVLILVWNVPAIDQGHNLKNLNRFPNSTKIHGTAILSANSCK